MKFVFEYQKLDIIGRLVDFLVVMISPVIIIGIIFYGKITPLNFTAWIILVGYYGCVVFLLYSGNILHPDQNPLILGWYIKKKMDKELEEFGKLSIQ